MCPCIRVYWMCTVGECYVDSSVWFHCVDVLPPAAAAYLYLMCCLICHLECYIAATSSPQNAFVQLSLAFRNDNYTLETRLKQAERERNLTEEDTEKELEEFKGALKVGPRKQYLTLHQRNRKRRIPPGSLVLLNVSWKCPTVNIYLLWERVQSVGQQKRDSGAHFVVLKEL